MQRLTFRIRKEVMTRMTHPAFGFNAVMRELCQEPEFKDQPVTEFDFGLGSDNFWLGAISSDELSATSRKAPQTMVLYTQVSQNLDNPKFQVFGGEVTAFIEVYMSWTDAQARHDFETPTDLMEEALVRTFNAIKDGGPTMPHYTGKLQINRGPVTQGADDNWERTLRMTMPFIIVVEN